VDPSPQHKARTLTAALILAATASGCVLHFDSTSLGVPASMASAASQPAVGDTFNVRLGATYLFWGLVPVSQPDLENTLESQLAGGRAVRDLKITVGRRIPDIVITVLTLGVVSPVSVRFEGIVAAPSP
jgi:hypothetical protein